MQYLGLTLDPFQEKAVRAIDRGESVIVAAPTGCGKTLIADYAVDIAHSQGRRVIYTAPIKALSNQKYRDFRERLGEEAVGIQTGDVTINPTAPLLIMTTEIFRNLLLEDSERVEDIYYVVFDEIHYLDDPERGTVWEESIILAPPEIRFVCLSATVPNIEELAQWMTAVRGSHFEVIVEHHRPVPLKHNLYSPRYGTITLRGIKRLYKRNPALRKKFLRKKPTSRKIIKQLVRMGRFPILYFCFNRRACERNAEQHAGRKLLTDTEYELLSATVDELVERYHLEGYDRLDRMRRQWESGVAFHHAGILPAAKEIVERLFTTGLIKLLFCTETFALGINMPANSVVFDELEKFDGVDFNYLSTRHYQQMAGRAGRRGMDEVGYVYSQIVPEASDPKHIERILYGRTEKISSRFFASYSTILNLYSRFGEGAFEIFRKSLRNYRKGSFGLTKSYQKQEAQIRNRIAFLESTGFLQGTELTEKGKLASVVSGYEIQAAELYYTRSFDSCTPEQLTVLLGALITEESRTKRGAQRHEAASIQFRFSAEKVIRNLRKRETKFSITNPIPPMDFSLAAPIYAWANGCDLNELLSFGVPEGDLIRTLRMTIQLLRTLRDRLPDPVMAERMNDARELINRGVVDAQAQLEVR